MPGQSAELVEHFFRHESAALVSVLTRAFGMRRMELVEDMVQAAMLDALDVWKHRGLPDNPAAWIHRVAKNRVLDALRREKTFAKAAAHADSARDVSESFPEEWLQNERIPDSLLRMMFVCCHPVLDRRTQIALTLKTLCGFSVSEVACGLLLPEPTVRKRIQRAKKTLADVGAQPELPGDDELARRLDAVHEVLYLLFNEGYSTADSIEPIRDDICEEAARLCHLLCESECSTPASHALLSLMLFHSSRLEARIDADGTAVLLEDQDRSLWDRRLITAAQCRLMMSKTDQPTRYHLEAGIAAQHCTAASVATTDWAMISALYDRLLQIADSPIYRLNRAIADGQTGRTSDSLSQLLALKDLPELKDYVLLDCAVARIYEQQGRPDEAVQCYREALTQKVAPHQKRLLERRLRKLTE